MKAIVNATLVMHDHLIPEAYLLIENGRIAAFGEMRGWEIPGDCEVIDAGGLFVGPGLAALLCSFLIEPVFRRYEEKY